jgi:precorrin-4/cobalt-precorrin-4 C11-methyltransferase
MTETDGPKEAAVSARHTVYFIGAGPGDPELITVKGQRLLKEADVIIYTGSLVPKALITGLKAEIHDSAGLNLDEVFAITSQSWQAGKKVVRLHTGDPSIYGAINEQIALLNENAIPFSVVPGVSSGLATAAALRTELTLPEVSQTVIFTRRGGRTPVPEKEDLALLASHQATMMIFLSVGMIEDVVTDLLAGGYPEDTPVAIVEKVSWPDEKQIRGTLSTIAAQVAEAGITKTAIIAVGKVLAEGPPPALSKLYDEAFTHGYRKGSSRP